jgi:hypothetical protein
MTEQQKNWFEKLVKDREDSANNFEKPSNIGIWHSIIHKYSEQAHFIYELLQNADDVKAQKVSFELTKEGLYFKHNGSIPFSITDIATEGQDFENDTLGHINAITGIGFSGKKHNEGTIGTFGMGFKAVFQYTRTPHIYDPYFKFKIERFIVPQKLENDLPDRKSDETVFYFPFDKKEMLAEQACTDILGKLKRLIYPTLFLSNLQEVWWKTDTESGEYSKKSKQKPPKRNIACEKIDLYQQIGLEQTTEKMWLFTRFIEGQDHTYSVGFFIGENGKLKPKKTDAFCFFPTIENTGLNFILHAPFLLTDSREGIKKGQTNGWNEDLIAKLAQLAADSLLILKDLKLIDDDIIKIVPCKVSDFYTKSLNYPYSTTPKFFFPFFDKIKNKLQTDELLPSLNGEYVNSKNAYWASAPTLPQLFSNERLALLYENTNAKWIFSSLGYNNVQGTDKELANYISDLSNNSQVAPNTILGKINYKFTENQEFEWLQRLYEYLSENNSYQDTVKTKPIFKDSKGNAAFAFNYDNSSKKHELVLFLLEEKEETVAQEESFYKTVHPDLLKNEKSREFIENFGIKRPSLKDEIYNHILPLYQKDGEIDTETHFKKFFKYWKDEGRPEDFINLIKDKEFVSYKTKEDETTYSGKANTIYYPSPDLQGYFVPKPDTKFVDLEDYHKFIEEKDKQTLKEFLLKIGVSELPRIITSTTQDWQNRTIIEENKLDDGINIHNRRYEFSTLITDKSLDGLEEIMKNIDSSKSLLLWKFIAKLSHHCFAMFEYAVSTYDVKRKEFPSNYIKKLKTTKWLLSTANEFVAPFEITTNELAERYERNRELIDLLCFKSEKTEDEVKSEITNKYSSEQLKEMEKLWLQKTTPPPAHSVQPSFEGFDEGIEWLEKVKKEYAAKPKAEPNENNNSESTTTATQPDLNFDEDEEFAKGIDDLKKQLEVKKQRIDLVTKINGLKRYSYTWFETFLNLLNTYAEKQSITQQKTVSFQEIKRHKTDNKYFLLRGASAYVSTEIEDASDIKLKLVFKNNQNEPIIVEGVSKKGQDLLVYCPNSLSQRLILRFSEVVRIEINFTPVIDLIERLYKAFINRNYLDEWEEIRDALPALNYIYGPPGTGKTTILCNKINEILQEDADAKFLILTPTTKPQT